MRSRPRLGASPVPSGLQKPIDINLAETAVWQEEWDPAGGLMERVGELAALWEVDEDLFANLLGALFGGIRSRRRGDRRQAWNPRQGPRLTWDDVTVAWRGFQKDALPKFDDLIGLALQDMYEAALIPARPDIESALEQAAQDLQERARDRIDYELWDPLFDKGLSAQDILRRLLDGPRGARGEGTVSLVYKDGAPILRLDLWKSPAVQELLRSLPEDQALGPVLEGLSDEFQALAEAYSAQALRILRKDMREIDPDSRIPPFEGFWKLEFLPRADTEGVKVEILEYLAHPHHGPGAGERVVFVRDVDRYPDFLVPKGTTGTVTRYSEEEVWVRLDAPMPGAEQWDNQVHWFEDSYQDYILDVEPLEEQADVEEPS